MILDRNINANGRGKYALILVRTLDGYRKENPVWDAIKLLEKEGIIRWGNESPDKRFFVLGYGDKFTEDALRGYGAAVIKELYRIVPGQNKASLLEYADQIHHEADLAAAQGRKIPE